MITSRTHRALRWVAAVALAVASLLIATPAHAAADSIDEMTVTQTIDANGVTTWDSEIVTLSEITERLKATASPDESRVLIAADEEARHKQVLGVLNSAREAGIEKVSFETKP